MAFRGLRPLKKFVRSCCTPASLISQPTLRTHARVLEPVGFGATSLVTQYSRSLMTKRPIATAAIDHNALTGIEYGYLLEYLHDQYGLAQQAVEGTLSELAQILGYHNIDSNTVIEFGDTKILMEEVGTEPATRKELHRFLAAKGAFQEEEDDNVQEFYQLQKLQEVLDLAEERSATIEQCGKRGGWNVVTMAKGTRILFKSMKGKVLWSSME